MAPARLLAFLLFAGLSSGCASPAAMSGLGARIAGAFPGLSYLNGDPEAGTTTLASLPLLTYRTTEEHPGFFDSETYVVAFLGRFAQTDRYVRLTWPEGEAVQAEGPPPDWWDRDRLRDGPRTPRPSRTRTREAEESGEADGSNDEAPRGVVEGPSAVDAEASSRSAELPADKTYLVLRLPHAAKIVKQLPAQRTEWDVLLGLIGHHAERPAEVLIRPTSKLLSKSERKRVVYEVGPTRDSFRLLPLLSFRRGPEGSQFMFWPLLLGFEREGDERYMRVFYFLKVPLAP